MILITNDDGVFSEGIIKLTEVLSKKYEVCVLAPDRERSTVGHAITVRRPLRLWKIEKSLYPDGVEVYACDGTPADCVILALSDVIKKDIKMIVSGINNGGNLGDEITYSGTVAAAIEGALYGVKSMAVSLVVKNSNLNGNNFETAAVITSIIIEWMLNQPIKRGSLININIPDVSLEQIKGIKVTEKGTKLYKGKVTPLKDPRGNTYYWIAGIPQEDKEEGTDVWAVSEGFVSLTPIDLDLTDRKLLYEFNSINLSKQLTEKLKHLQQE